MIRNTSTRSTKIAASLLAAALAGSMCVPAAAFADPSQPIDPAGDVMAATSVKAGSYSVSISANNRMFKPTEGVLSITKKGATVSFNHTGYDFVWLGTAEEYQAAAEAGDVTTDARYIAGETVTSLNSAGGLKSGCRFTLPVSNLNETFDIAVYSSSKKQMLDRKICVNCADKSALVAAANVKVSVSNAGKLVNDANVVQCPMAARQVVATDTNNDGKVSCAEVLAAAGSKFMLDEKALAKSSVIKGDKLVAKNTKEQVKNGDSIVAFTYAKKGKDSYAAFNNKSAASVKAGKTLSLTLKGIEAKKANGKNKLTVVKGSKKITVTCTERFGVDGAAAVQIASKKLSKKGTVALKFDTAGTYVVTAKGKTAKGSTIIAPVCLVTVTE